MVRRILGARCGFGYRLDFFFWLDLMNGKSVCRSCNIGFLCLWLLVRHFFLRVSFSWMLIAGGWSKSVRQTVVGLMCVVGLDASTVFARDFVE